MNNAYEYAKGSLRAHLLENTGRVIASAELREVFGRHGLKRCLRELRDDEGYQIVTHSERNELKPGEYFLETGKPLPVFAPDIPETARASALARGDLYCYMCGAVAGDTHLYDSTRNVRLHIGHIIDKTMGGSDEAGNLRALCSNCNEGASNITLMRPDLRKLIAEVRRATGDDQIGVLKWLVSKYPDEAKALLP